MTIDISANVPRISYTVAASITQTSFTVPFEFFDDSDLNVYIDQVLQTITTNYTVTGGSGSTGAVTMTVTGPKTVIITRDTTIERTTDFTAGVDINRAALNTQLDTLTAIAADNKDFIERSIRIKDFDPSTASLELPDATTRADKLLSFDTEGNVTTISNTTALIAASILGANYIKNTFTGDGTATAFTLSDDPVSKNNIQIYVNGIYQPKDSFSLSTTTLTFSEAPPSGIAVECIIGQPVTSYTIPNKFILGDGDEVTIASGVITASKSYHEVDTESDASTDDLDTINGGSKGMYLVLTAANSARTVVVKDGTGNIQCSGDFSLTHINDTITLIYNGSNWLEISRSNNDT